MMTLLKEKYQTSSRAYLQRAKQKLDSGSSEDLFYACLNLRCGIESRISEYLEPYPYIPNKQKSQWRLGILDKACDKYFQTHKKIQKIIISNPDHAVALYYIPVSSLLIKNGEKFGQYLHYMKKYEEADNGWWKTFRELLEETYAHLDFVCKGNLLGPVLVQDSRGALNIDLFENREEIERIAKLNVQLEFHVTYHKAVGLILP